MYHQGFFCDDGNMCRIYLQSVSVGEAKDETAPQPQVSYEELRKRKKDMFNLANYGPREVIEDDPLDFLNEKSARKVAETDAPRRGWCGSLMDLF